MDMNAGIQIRQRFTDRPQCFVGQRKQGVQPHHAFNILIGLFVNKLNIFPDGSPGDVGSVAIRHLKTERGPQSGLFHFVGNDF